MALNISLILIYISNHGNQILLIFRTVSDALHNKSWINPSHLITYFYRHSKLEILEMSVRYANWSHSLTNSKDAVNNQFKFNPLNTVPEMVSGECMFVPKSSSIQGLHPHASLHSVLTNSLQQQGSHFLLTITNGCGEMGVIMKENVQNLKLINGLLTVL